MELLAQFLEEAPAHLRGALSSWPSLPGWLAEALRRAHAAHPDVTYSDAAFVSVLARKLPPDAVEQLAELQVEDLYLVAAALERDRAALSRLDALIAQVVSREAARARAKELEDDVRQTLGQRLLLSTGTGASPSLTQYSGRGALAAWIRVVAVRELLRAKQRERKAMADEGSEDEALELAAAPVGSPELGPLRGQYREAFRAAFRDAVDALESKQRLLLRQHFLDGLSLDALARLHQVHRATIARWIAQARESIAHTTRERLRAHLAQQPAGLDSVLEVVGSQLEVSLGALLRTIHS